MIKRLTQIFSLIVIASMFLAACKTSTPAPTLPPQIIEVTKIVEGKPVVQVITATAAPTTPPQIVEVTKIVAGTPVVQVITATPAPTTAPVVYKPVTIWTKFNDTNPQNSQDEWLANTIIALQRSLGLKMTNVFAPYDQINNKLQLAVQAGGEIPDVSYMDTPLDPYYNNGILMDITEFVKSAPWYNDIDPVYFKPCTGPDGKIYCVPAISGGTMMYYWTSAYPNGFPKDTDELLKAAAELKKQGKYALTFKGSEGYGANLFFFHLVYSIGGRFTDEAGNTVFASPETVKAVEFLRELFANKYVPDVALSPGFDCETPFRDGSAGAFVAGSWSYVYLNPLTSFDGASTFDFGALSVEEAMKAGALKIADPLVLPGGKPAININGATGWAIPVGSKNVEGAKAVINFLMQPGNNADYAFAYGALPTNSVGLKDPRFVDSYYWKAAAESFSRTGIVAPVNKNPKSGQVINDTIVTLILNPDMDIMKTLQKAQDDLNAGQ
jgi:multiple sugar transport system substrate-binding protein